MKPIALHDFVVNMVTGQQGVVRAFNGDNAQVYFDQKNVTWLPVSQLRVVPDDYQVLERERLIPHLVALKYERPLGDHLYSRSASRTRFEAHQFKPAIKFFEHGARTLLIADEVGLGKTIEAAIIYSELAARSATPLQRVLVVCPSGLKEKWRDELLVRFGEEFTIADSTIFRKALADYELGYKRHFRLICSIEMLRQGEFRDAFATLGSQQGFSLDLAIIDEAHHFRNPETQTHELGEEISAYSDCLLLLTATPVQLGREDLFHLVSLMDPDLFPSVQVFDEAIEPNRHVHALVAALRKRDALSAVSAVESLVAADRTGHFTGSPYLSRVTSFLDSDAMTPEAYALATLDAKELNTMGSLLTRTKKIEVSQAALRKSQTVSVTLTPEELAYYDAVSAYARRLAAASGFGASFGVVTRERQAASCIPASLEHFRERWLPEDIEGSVEGLPSESDSAQRGRVIKEERFANDIVRLGLNCVHDSKFTAFKKVLTEALAEKPRRKVLVFSFFKGTIRYLDRRVREEGIQTVVMTGDVHPRDRAKLMQRFKEDPDLHVLLSSEVGSEGLDLQFCDTVINYDLPWNPMRVEQRIGRLDRYGQLSPSIGVVSFFLENTIEERVLKRLYERIEVFEHSIGELEPILGGIISDLERTVFSTQLTPEEEVEVAKQLLQQIETRKQALGSLVSVLDQFMGSDELISQITALDEHGLSIRSDDIQECVTYAFREFGGSVTPVVAHPGMFRLRSVPRLLEELGQTLKEMGQIAPEHHRLIDRLGEEDEVWVLFDGNLAVDHPEYADRPFIGAGHPIARFAVRVAGRDRDGYSKRLVYRVTLGVDSLPDRTAWLVVYRFAKTGAFSGDELRPIVVAGARVLDEALAWAVFGQLRLSLQSRAVPDEASFDDVSERGLMWAAGQRNRMESELLDRASAAVNARRASVERSTNAKIAKRQELARKATNEGIRRMREGEVRNLRLRLTDKLKVIEEELNVSVEYEDVLYVHIENSSAAPTSV